MGCRFSGQSSKTTAQQAIGSDKSSKSSEKANSSRTAAIIESIGNKESNSVKVEGTQPSSEKSSKRNEEIKQTVEKHAVKQNDRNKQEMDMAEMIRAAPSKNQQLRVVDAAHNAPPTDDNGIILDDNKQKEVIPNNEQLRSEEHKKRGKRRRRTIQRRTRPLVVDPEDDTLFEIPLRMPEIDLSAEVQANA